LVKSETKKLVFGTAAPAAGGLLSVQLVVPDGMQNNLHNIWLGMGAEPETAGANSHGQWVLYVEPDSVKAIFTPSITNLNLENLNWQIVACGTWYAANEMPFNFSTQIKTSRNIRQNGRMILAFFVEGATAGNTRITISLCAGAVTF